MYEYKATVVGPLSSLRREKKVAEVGVSLADAYTAALNHYGSQGWKLHSVVAISSPIVLLVFEKEVPPPNPAGTYTYTTDNLGCSCLKPQVAETDGGESA